MSTNERSRLIPVAMFRAGPLEAVVWQPLEEARKRHGNGHTVLIRRLVRGGRRGRETCTLRTPDELLRAIEALNRAQDFLSLQQTGQLLGSGMFVPAIEMLEAKTQW